MTTDPLFPPLPHRMRPRGEAAAADARLRSFLRSATQVKNDARRGVLPAAFGDRVDALRRLAGRVRRHTLDHLDYYLDAFATRAARTGTRVHFARDAAQACDVVVGIAREAGATRCVKSKSMVTEEIRLLRALEAAGVETVETDLGEFILQLDGDAPSHIVTPVIHKDRAAVGEAFRRELGVAFTDDPERLTRIAREHLRAVYRRADLGITGANFLVAETGDVVVCTNEGNGRFCATVPRVHVVVAGIERVVPREEHLALMLKLLARSSTGQPLTCYTQILSGPRRAAEPDGPEEVHVVLVDNGRTGLLEGPTREILQCIRCGACLNACPVYRVVGGHAYGSVYPGPIGALWTPHQRGLANYLDLPQASSLCGACSEACPVAIDIPRHLVGLRREQVRQRSLPLGERVVMRLWALVLRFAPLYLLAAGAHRRWSRLRARLAGTLERGDPLAARGWLRRAGGPARDWTAERDLPTPPAETFRRWWGRHDE